MNERSPRRGTLELTAEQLDYKESKARTDNKRARNRLHINKQTLKGHENTYVSSLDYEMRRLKHELRGIKQTSGYFVIDKDTSEEGMKLRQRNKRRSRVKVTRKVSRTTESIPELTRQTEYPDNTKTVSLPALATISSASSDSSGKNNTRTQEEKSQDNVTDYKSDIPAVTLDLQSNSNKLHSNDTIGEPYERLKTSSWESKETNKNTSEGLLGIDVEAARNRVQNRLGTEGSFQVDDTGDLTPYMHVPPDGLPRTAYLLPPLQDLLCEAKKARYIRKLRKRNAVFEKDDPERELNIDEIFSRNSR